MAFAALFGCNTSDGNDGMAYYWRCVKGVDTVVGFDDPIMNLTSHCFNENFFWWTGHGYSVYSARALALNDVHIELLDNGLPDYYGVETLDIWGNINQSINSPHFGSSSY